MESVLVVPKHLSPEHGPTSGPAAVMGGRIAVNEKLGKMSLGLGEETVSRILSSCSDLR